MAWAWIQEKCNKEQGRKQGEGAGGGVGGREREQGKRGGGDWNHYIAFVWLTCIHNNAGHRSGVPHNTSSEEEVTPVHPNTLKTGLQVGLQTMCAYTRKQ